MTPLTLLSTSFCAAAVPCLGSPASSSAAISNLIFLPPMVRFCAFSSSMARRTPFSVSLPMWAMPPEVGPAWAILTVCTSCA